MLEELKQRVEACDLLYDRDVIPTCVATLGTLRALIAELERLQYRQITSDSIARERGWLDPPTAAKLQDVMAALHAYFDVLEEPRGAGGLLDRVERRLADLAKVIGRKGMPT